MKTLMRHQKDALSYASNRRHVAFFMEMRLGKTLVSIRWAKKHNRILVIAPLPVLPVWEEELDDENESHYTLLGTARDRYQQATTAPAKWFIINFEGLRAAEQICNLKWDAVIVDESTRIRNPKAKITRIVTERFRHVKHKAILSGLPAPESPLDYFSQFKFLFDEWGGCYNYWQFRLRYFHQATTQWDWQPNKGTMQAIKTQVHEDAYVLTRKQAGIGSKKIYSKRYVGWSPEQRKAYKKVEQDWELRTDGKIRLTNYSIVTVQWLARLAGGISDEGSVLSNGKISELRSLLIDGELRDEQVVVWFRFNKELETTFEHMKTVYQLDSCAKITGRTKREERRSIISSFQKGQLRVLFLQIKVGKFGLNLASASTAIYYSNNYDSEDRAQSEERIISPKKVDPVLYIDLLTKGSIDEDVLSVLREKKVESRFFMVRVMERWRERSETPIR